MAKDTPFDRARDFVEEKIDRTKEVLGDSYGKAREQFDDVSDDVRKTVKSTAKKIEKRLRVPLGRRARLRAREPGHGAGDLGGGRLRPRVPAPRRRRLAIRRASVAATRDELTIRPWPTGEGGVTRALSTFASSAGCACKIPQFDLAALLRERSRRPTDPNLLVGNAESDDAAVYRLPGGQTIVQTVDFFTPVVDDPRLFGRIAATNALSDVYAMRGAPGRSRSRSWRFR